ncbi:hypothetical protein EAE99_006808 [Botrytis elliptica]|nr:hypothetical protein EAE99_006808 [Botrytis elliptica]
MLLHRDGYDVHLQNRYNGDNEVRDILISGQPSLLIHIIVIEYPLQKPETVLRMWSNPMWPSPAAYTCNRTCSTTSMKQLRDKTKVTEQGFHKDLRR